MHTRRLSIERRHGDSCQWLFDLEEYQSWRSSSRGLLWIKGKPGSGKSTLMSFLHKKIESSRSNNSGIHLDFFFHARGSELQRTSIGMFRCLLCQILVDENSRAEVRESYRQQALLNGDCEYSWQMPLAALKELLETAILASAPTKPVTIFVDALDEAGADSATDLANFFQELNETAEKNNLSIKICISCRHYPVPSAYPAVEIVVEKHNQEDIANYLRAKLEPKGFRTQLVDMLIQRSNNIFQWANTIRRAVEQGNQEDILPKDSSLGWLDEVPVAHEDMEATYEYILEHVITRRNRTQSLLLLQLVSLAERPLSTKEMRQALAACDAHKTHLPRNWDEIKFEPKGVFFDKWRDRKLEEFATTERPKFWFRALSGGLVEVCRLREGSGWFVQVIHQSVNDYLHSKGLSHMVRLIEKSALPNDEIMLRSQARVYQSCLNSLAIELSHRFFEFEKSDANKLKQEKLELLRHRPFVHYATMNLFVHAEKARGFRTDSLEMDIERLQCILGLWLELYELFHVGDHHHWPPKKSNLMHMAAAANLEDVIVSLISNSQSTVEVDSDENTALHIASKYGHMKVAKMLRAKGSDCLAKNKRAETPLIMAAQNGHMGLVRWLLGEERASSVTDHTENALHEASKYGQESTVRFLIYYGANVNFHGGEYGTALQAASFSGSPGIVEKLLEEGADVNAQGGIYGTALQAASFSDSPEIVNILIAAKANVNAYGGEYGTALQAASSRRNKNIVTILLDKGADVNAQTSGEWGTALAAASGPGSLEIVEMLLNKGADVNIKGGKYGTSLQVASFMGNFQIVEMLLDKGANVNAEGGAFGTALHAASFAGARLIVERLLKDGANVDTQSGDFGTALHLASQRGMTQIVKILLKEGANVNTQGGAYGSALQAASSSGTFTTITTLLNAGANLNAQGGTMGSALRIAADKGNFEIVGKLIKLGAKANPQGGEHNITSTKDGFS